MDGSSPLPPSWVPRPLEFPPACVGERCNRDSHCSEAWLDGIALIVMLGVREREKLPLEFSEPGRALRKEDLPQLELCRAPTSPPRFPELCCYVALEQARSRSRRPQRGFVWLCALRPGFERPFSTRGSRPASARRRSDTIAFAGPTHVVQTEKSFSGLPLLAVSQLWRMMSSPE